MIIYIARERKLLGYEQSINLIVLTHCMQNVTRILIPKFSVRSFTYINMLSAHS